MAKSNAKELARRLAQSKKDKAATKSLQSKKAAKVEKIFNSGVKEKTQKAPVAMGKESRSTYTTRYGGRYKDMVTVTGSDHLEYVLVPTSNTTGEVCNEIYISPSEFGGTRLEKWAAIYEKYRFINLEFEYVPAAGSTDKGVIGLAYDRDISDPTPPANEQGVREFTAFEGAVDGNIWMNHRCKAKLTSPEAGYFTNPAPGGDDRLSYQGQFYTYVVAPFSLSAGVTIGRLRMHYTCEFFTPQLQGSTSGAQMFTQDPADIAPGVAGADFLAKVTQTPGDFQGVAQWKPLVDSLGKYYQNLSPGVYQIIKTLRSSSLGQTLGVNAGTTFLSSSIVQPNEPMPASAPQPWTQLSNVVAAETAAGDVFSGANTVEFVGVPRGGAKVYQQYSSEGGLDNAAGFGELIYEIDIQRIANYMPSFSSLFLERYVGDECRTPDKFKEVARARSNHKRWVRTQKRETPEKTKAECHKVCQTMPVLQEIEIENCQKKKLVRGDDCPPGPVLKSWELASRPSAAAELDKRQVNSFLEDQAKEAGVSPEMFRKVLAVLGDTNGARP